MFTVYYSNKLSSLAEMLIHFQKINPNPNPFESETILVQSTGMAQWLQMRIAQETGIAGSYEFPFPTSFLWQQYRLVFPELPKENIFERKTVTWRLMYLIPQHLEQAEFTALKNYLTHDTREYVLKLYQLASKVADLFDQYLVYRPHWLVHWESGNLNAVVAEIQRSFSAKPKSEQDVLENMLWQSILWNALVANIRQETEEVLFNTSHRAYLQERYFQKLDNLAPEEQAKLPKRIFVFGISSLPTTQLSVLRKLSEHCDVHLFFLNPSQVYWGDNIEEKALEKMALNEKLTHEDLEKLKVEQGNQLLTIWGKQGREFLVQLVEQEPNQLEVFEEYVAENNLERLKQAILEANNAQQFELDSADYSLQFHACHSEMREVEVLHNHLLHLFEQNPDLSPKDIIVMSADIDKYAPYINAVFSRFKEDYKDKRYIPYSVSDQKITAVNPIIASFTQLFGLKESQFEAESLLDLLDVIAIREKFNFTQEDIYTLRHWIKNAGIRSGLNIKQAEWQNYNSWENGLNRLLLGSSLKEENGIWQETISFNESYGLSSIIIGYLSQFITQLTQWNQFIQTEHSINEWQLAITQLIENLYLENNEYLDSILLLKNALNSIVEKVEQAHFEQPIPIEILQLLFDENLNEQQNNLNFLVGKVNFCTLLPMRAIPFKVVCLLGMNEADFPRQQSINSFDLMQLAPQKGDRAKRDDDRYLFLEALLSAQEVFYVSYIGQSPKDNKPKLPSVLVSQLLDYLFDHLSAESLAALSEQHKDPQNTFIQQIVQTHPITVFSPRNFTAQAISYNKEWLAVLDSQQQHQPFLNDKLLSDNTPPTEIELEDLIAFIQNPTKFFFNRQLGIYFSREEEGIEETENFTLDGLGSYQLKDQMIYLNASESEQFFQQEQLKGNLPIANFAKIQEQKLSTEVQEMRTAIADYLDDSEIFEIDQFIELNGQKIRIVGNIKNQFAQEIVFWKVSLRKDKDLIRLWIYNLFMQRQDANMTLKHISLSNGKVENFSFKAITAEEREAQIQCYLNDYLAGYTQLYYAISDAPSDYLKGLKDEQDIEHYCHSALMKMQDNDYFDNAYLKRVLQQTAVIDYQKIHQTTLDWFEKMYFAASNKE